MPIYLTEYLASNEAGRACRMGGEIEADSWAEAESVAVDQGHDVVGLLVEEIEAPEMHEFCEKIQAQRDADWRR